MSSTSFLQQCLTSVARWVPHQGPIKDFIHHNTLHAFQQYPFFEGCLRASRLYGARTFLPLATYRSLFRGGQITERAVCEVVRESDLLVARGLRQDEAQAGWVETLCSVRWGEYEPMPGIVETGLRSRWKSHHGLKLNHRIHPKLYRLLGQYFDQGISMWEAPHPEVRLFDFVRQLVEDSWLPLRPWSSSTVKRLLQVTPEEVIETVLKAFLGPDSEPYYERYLLEMCLAHPGWSGMVSELERHPEHLLEHRQVALQDLCALELMAEYAYVVMDLGPGFDPLISKDCPAPGPLPTCADYSLTATDSEQVAYLWQQSFERSYRQELLGRLSEHRACRPLSAPSDTRPKVQAFFCIDDREGGLRRHLEAQDPAIETFGFAGFFGVDCVFQGVDDAFPSKQCPGPVHPKHRIREFRVDSRRDVKSLNHLEIDDHSDALVRGFVISQTLGLWSAVKLALSIFRPSLNPLVASSLQKVDDSSALVLHRTSEHQEGGFFSGYSDEEMADRVERVLRCCGLTAERMAPLVLFAGHGSSSVNNPYFAAYDCGACGGRSGGPNARAVAMMANRPQVRELLRSRGVEIPPTTWFVGSIHDTTRDEMRYFDTDEIPTAHRPLFAELRSFMETAVGLNAKERCGRFANMPTKLDPRDAILAVRRRSVSIFEPRPELNHATNASCLVGRRWISKGLSLERRCFLNSYDPEVDPDGEILSALLGSLIPVCAGINLEYYFSRLDPDKYGAGSKLPHNIQGLIGVINGTEGDLLTGLPTQMTEVHDPLRLLFIVEQTPQLVLRVLGGNPEVAHWLDNGWVLLLCWDYRQGTWFEYRDQAFRPIGVKGTSC